MEIRPKGYGNPGEEQLVLSWGYLGMLQSGSKVLWFLISLVGSWVRIQHMEKGHPRKKGTGDQ